MPPKTDPVEGTKTEGKDQIDKERNEGSLEGRPLEGNDATSRAQHNANNQANNQATGNTAHETANNEDLLNNLEHELEVPGELDGNNTVRNPKDNTKLPVNFSDRELILKGKREHRANELVEQYKCTGLQGYVNASNTLRANGFKIQAEEVQKLIDADPEGKEWAIVDLRNPNNLEGDYYDSKIPGATPFPLSETLASTNIALGVMPGINESPAITRAWSLELAKPESPFRTLQQKPIIIFHCKQSTNRTPMFASSYIVAIAQRTGQKVVILEGGFEGYKLKEQKVQPVSEGEREQLKTQMENEEQWANAVRANPN